jgi:hypothetical protein
MFFLYLYRKQLAGMVLDNSYIKSNFEVVIYFYRLGHFYKFREKLIFAQIHIFQHIME